MKIYSKGREATVTFVTREGVVFTVGHFYRGYPVLIENKIPVKVLSIGKVFDFFLGLSPLRIGAKLNLTTFDYDMQIMIKGNSVKYGRVIEPLDTFHWLTTVPVTEGESGAPVIDPNTDAIIGYVTHSTVNGSIVMPLVYVSRSIQAAIEKARKLNGEEEQQTKSEEESVTEEA